jgi:pilus assembly protein Flp/PilA
VPAQIVARRMSGSPFTTRPAGHKEDIMRQLWNNFVADESGQGLVEYVLIIALVAIGLIGIMLLFRDSIGDIFSTIKDELDEAPAEAYSTG